MNSQTFLLPRSEFLLENKRFSHVIRAQSFCTSFLLPSNRKGLQWGGNIVLWAREGVRSVIKLLLA